MPSKIIIKCQVPLEPLIITSRSMSRFKTKQAPGGELESLVHEDICYTTKELKEFANLFKQKSGGYV